MVTATNVGTRERIASTVVGATLIARAVARPSLARGVAAAGGLMLLLRGLTGYCALYQATGIGAGPKPSSERPLRVRRDRVEQASEDSFPASDPPAWTPVRGALAGRAEFSLPSGGSALPNGRG